MQEDKYAAQKRYHERIGMTGFYLHLSPKTEQDIIDMLNSVPNKAGYIKRLIREDIVKNSK